MGHKTKVLTNVWCKQVLPKYGSFITSLILTIHSNKIQFQMHPLVEEFINIFIFSKVNELHECNALYGIYTTCSIWHKKVLDFISGSWNMCLWTNTNINSYLIEWFGFINPEFIKLIRTNFMRILWKCRLSSKFTFHSWLLSKPEMRMN